MIKVLIVDDHPIVRQGLRQVLRETSEIVVAGEAGNDAEAFNQIKNNDYDLILLDIALPGRNGLEILRQMKIEKPNLNVLILSTYPEEQYAIRALRDGAVGYLTKASAPEELLNAIYKVSAGGKYVSVDLAEKLASVFSADNKKPPHETLSNSEYHVMCMIASGKRLNEIAQELSLSVKSITLYRARVLEKMNLKSNAEITHYVIKQGLIN